MYLLQLLSELTGVNGNNSSSNSSESDQLSSTKISVPTPIGAGFGNRLGDYSQLAAYFNASPAAAAAAVAASAAAAAASQGSAATLGSILQHPFVQKSPQHASIAAPFLLPSGEFPILIFEDSLILLKSKADSLTDFFSRKTNQTPKIVSFFYSRNPLQLWKSRIE